MAKSDLVKLIADVKTYKLGASGVKDFKSMHLFDINHAELTYHD